MQPLCIPAENILLAKLATRKAKPNGQFHLLPEDVAEFIKDKSVSDLPGMYLEYMTFLSKLQIIYLYIMRS